MITEDYVSNETAKLLKEKGFNEPCLMCYTFDGKLENYGHYRSCKNSDVFSLTAPTHQMVMKWLREVHKLDIIPFHERLPLDCYWCRIEKYPYTEFEQEPIYEKYEQACEEAIKYCLEKLI